MLSWKCVLLDLFLFGVYMFGFPVQCFQSVGAKLCRYVHISDLQINPTESGAFVCSSS